MLDFISLFIVLRGQIACLGLLKFTAVFRLSMYNPVSKRDLLKKHLSKETKNLPKAGRKILK